jgi:hypothetical protein
MPHHRDPRIPQVRLLLLLRHRRQAQGPPPSPPVRVLFYTWAGRKPAGVDTIGSVPTLDDMENQPGLLLKDKETGDTLVVSDGGSIGLGRGDDPRRRQFRGMPLPGSQFSSLPVIGGGTTMTPDGKWHTLVMNFDMACARSGRFTFRRALFARLLGSLDIKRLRLDVGRLPPTPR